MINPPQKMLEWIAWMVAVFLAALIFRLGWEVGGKLWGIL